MKKFPSQLTVVTHSPACVWLPFLPALIPMAISSLISVQFCLNSQFLGSCPLVFLICCSSWFFLLAGNPSCLMQHLKTRCMEKVLSLVARIVLYTSEYQDRIPGQGFRLSFKTSAHPGRYRYQQLDSQFWYISLF